MSVQIKTEIPAVVTFTLKQFYSWLCRRAAPCEAAWDKSTGTLKDVLIMETNEFHQEGGYQEMTSLKFYMMDDFLKSFPDGNKFYWTLVSMMRLPFHLWDYLTIDLPACKVHLLDGGKLFYEQWCVANRLQPV